MNPVEVFISYSHRDERFLVGLSKHLAILKRQGLIRIWHDRKVPSGKNIDFEIDQNLEKSRLILLLVSSDFIASDYCYEKEMHKAMSMHAEGSAVVIPIIVRPVDWTAAPFSRLKALPSSVTA